jgi:hypothetical protein
MRHSQGISAALAESKPAAFPGGALAPWIQRYDVFLVAPDATPSGRTVSGRPARAAASRLRRSAAQTPWQSCRDRKRCTHQPCSRDRRGRLSRTGSRRCFGRAEVGHANGLESGERIAARGSRKAYAAQRTRLNYHRILCNRTPGTRRKDCQELAGDPCEEYGRQQRREGGQRTVLYEHCQSSTMNALPATNPFRMFLGSAMVSNSCGSARANGPSLAFAPSAL